MTEYLVDSSQMVTILGAGEADAGDLKQALNVAPTLIAADGGADFALDNGHMPDVVIGDFDSISEAARRHIAPDRMVRITEQDSTDFDKCLRNISAPLILGLGFMGARVDHQLSVFNRLAARPNIQCILIGREDVVFHAPPQLTLSLDIGTRVSLFPMTAVTGASTGLRWPIDGLEFAPAFRAGTSNEADAQTVTLSMDAPGMLVILPRNCLNAAVRAVQAASTAPWNVRA